MEEMRCGLCWGGELALWLGGTRLAGQGALTRLLGLEGALTSGHPCRGCLGETLIPPKHPVLGSLP